MARRSRWQRFVLVLALMLVALPALATGRAREERRSRGVVGEVWAAVVRWVAPWGGLKLGPGIDPDGVRGGSGEPEAAVQGGNGELGPGVDPNG